MTAMPTIPLDLERGLDGLYERDEVAWYGAMIELIEQGRTEEVDFANLKELLTSMARSDRREVESRLVVLLAHFLKWQYQPDQRSNSWRLTLEVQKQFLQDEIDSSGTLRNHAVEILEKAYRKGVRLAVIETGLPPETFPAACPVTLDELLA